MNENSVKLVTTSKVFCRETLPDTDRQKCRKELWKNKFALVAIVKRVPLSSLYKVQINCKQRLFEGCIEVNSQNNFQLMAEIARNSGKAICETAENENLLMLHAWRSLPERGGRQSAQ